MDGFVIKDSGKLKDGRGYAVLYDEDGTFPFAIHIETCAGSRAYLLDVCTITFKQAQAYIKGLQ